MTPKRQPQAGFRRRVLQRTAMTVALRESPCASQQMLDEPPAVGSEISAGFLFDVPVRFAEDRIDINRATFLAGEAPSVPLVEIREA